MSENENLIAEARKFRDALASIDQDEPRDGSLVALWLRTADALEAATRERATAHDAGVAAKALEDAASAWQINGWANDMPEKGAERAQIILHMAQAATEMLRSRAAEYRKAVQSE